MKNFKQILSLIAEAKLEPGGEDLGKLFGPRGKFRPEKAEAKEKTALQRMKSGELRPNPDRPSGMEELLRRNPPEEGEKEPTALSRMKSGEIDYRLMPSKPEQKKPKAEKETIPFPVVTNNLHHNSITMQRLMRNNDGGRELRATIKDFSPGFLVHSDALTRELKIIHDTYDKNMSDFDKNFYAQQLVANHFAILMNRMDDMERKLFAKRKTLPINRKFGKAMISHYTHDELSPGERTLKIHFHPLKTPIKRGVELKELIDHLNKHTGHSWYMDNEENQPLILATSINHPWLKGDDDDDNDDFPEPEPIVPKSPEGKKPSGPTGSPNRPRTPSLV